MAKRVAVGGSVALVDDEDYPRVIGRRWQLDRDGYAVGNQGLRLHRLVLGLRRGDGVVVDHVSEDRLDCRKANLRLATPSQNSLHKRAHRHFRGRPKLVASKGVTFEQDARRPALPGHWRARIMVQGRRVSLGWFATEEAAADAYDDAARALAGEFAGTNR